MRHGIVELSTLNIALLGRQPKFCKNLFLLFIFLILFYFCSNFHFANFGDSCFILSSILFCFV